MSGWGNQDAWPGFGASEIGRIAKHLQFGGATAVAPFPSAIAFPYNRGDPGHSQGPAFGFSSGSLLGPSFATVWTALASVSAVFTVKVCLTINLERTVLKAIQKILATGAAILGRQ